MSFLDTLRKDKIQAMKDKDNTKKNVVTNLMSQISLAEKEAGEDLSDKEAMDIVMKELKKNEESLEALPKDRTENIKEYEDRIAIIKSYLPKQMGDDELKALIEEIIEENDLERSPKSLGQIIGIITEEHPGQADGARISQLAKEIF